MQIQIDSATDQAILSALREGKRREAAGMLVRYHGNTIFSLCRTLVVDHDLAEDLTQETFHQAFTELDGIQGPLSPRSWLMGIAQRCCAKAIEANVADDLPEIDAAAGPDAGSFRISESLQRRLEMLASAL